MIIIASPMVYHSQICSKICDNSCMEWFVWYEQIWSCKGGPIWAKSVFSFRDHHRSFLYNYEIQYSSSCLLHWWFSYQSCQLLSGWRDVIFWLIEQFPYFIWENRPTFALQDWNLNVILVAIYNLKLHSIGLHAMHGNSLSFAF